MLLKTWDVAEKLALFASAGGSYGRRKLALARRAVYGRRLIHLKPSL
jgi:hypothetical protein